MMWLLLLLLIEATLSVFGKCSHSGGRPACSSDGGTYINICEFRREQNSNPALQLAHVGACACDPKHDGWFPICTSEGETYGSICEFQRHTAHKKNVRIAKKLLCLKFVTKRTISGSEYQKIFSWRRIMPLKLYTKLISRRIVLKNGEPDWYLKHQQKEKENVSQRRLDQMKVLHKKKQKRIKQRNQKPKRVKQRNQKPKRVKQRNQKPKRVKQRNQKPKRIKQRNQKPKRIKQRNQKQKKQNNTKQNKNKQNKGYPKKVKPKKNKPDRQKKQEPEEVFKLLYQLLQI